MAGHGAHHHSDNPDQKRVGIFISVLAVFMAVVTALANAEGNAMIVKQVESSNGFAWYQAKRQRSYMNDLELTRIDRELAGTPNEAQRKLLESAQARLRAKNAEYEKENEVIRIRSEGDRALAETAAHKHHRFEYAEVLLHIAVVLCSLTLLTDMKLFIKLGIAATVAGLILAGSGFFIEPHAASADSHPSAAATAPGVKPPGGH